MHDGSEEKILTFNSAVHGREGAEIRKSYSGTTDLPDSQMGGKKRGVIQEPLTFKTAIWEGVRGGVIPEPLTFKTEIWEGGGQRC